jgi:hypothetical protein
MQHFDQNLFNLSTCDWPNAALTTSLPEVFLHDALEPAGSTKQGAGQ